MIVGDHKYCMICLFSKKMGGKGIGAFMRISWSIKFYGK